MDAARMLCPNFHVCTSLWAINSTYCTRVMNVFTVRVLCVMPNLFASTKCANTACASRLCKHEHDICSAGIEDIFKAVRRVVKRGAENDVVSMARTPVFRQVL
jgi:hypothetical protein